MQNFLYQAKLRIITVSHQIQNMFKWVPFLHSMQGAAYLLSDHHKMTITVLKTPFQKQSLTIIKYRDYKRFDVNLFRSQLLDRLYSFGNNITYAFFETSVTHLLNLHSPLKTKHIRTNNGPFMNKILSKAIMTRSENRNSYKKHLLYTTIQKRKEKIL